MSEARQIQSMIDFIERETQEKVEEVEAAAQEEYDIEKMRLMEAEKNKIRANTEKRKKQVDIDRRVARANYSKAQRLRVMDARAKIMEDLLERTRKNIIAMVQDRTAYKKLLTSLIHQSLLSIRADTTFQVRMEDEAEVRSMVQELQRWYKAKTGGDISIRTGTDYLDANEAWGGVVAVSSDGRIVCNNTLSYRTKTCFEEQLPTVRYYLFNPEAVLP